MARAQHLSVRPYLPHALLATALVVLVPVIAVTGWIALSASEPSTFALLSIGFLLTTLTFAAGTLWWKRRPASADITFGELMIWGWLQRKRADDRLVSGAQLLGLDRTGQPTRDIRISPDKQLDVLHDLTRALESKDPYLHGHSQRVERHVYRTSAAMGLQPSDIEELRLAAALHDVGKIRVPDRILRKPESLTIEERAVMEEHVLVGAWMVSAVGSTDVISAVRHHHERWDGRGYPDGLAGTDIPFYARVIAVADAYDAITSTRPYRVSSGRDYAVDVIQRESGAQFDPMVVAAFVEALPVRLPVAGALLFLGGPWTLWRRLAVWLKRAGAGHIAPTAATLGAVVTLGTFIPSLPAPVAPAPATAVDVGVEQPTTYPQLDSIPRRQIDEPAEEPPPAEVTAEAGSEDIVLGTTLVRSPRPQQPEAAPEHSPAPPVPPEPTNECAEGEGDSDLEGGGKGKGHDKGRGKGHEKHHCD